MMPVLFYFSGTRAFGSIVALGWLGEPFNLLSQVPTYKSDQCVLIKSAAILQHNAFIHS